ncbi:MAG: ATP-binding protein [Herbaspirillum sp.]|nr:ATP-binding protein [Herbaspirillum sp.]
MRVSGKATESPIDLSHLSGIEYQKRVFECLVRRVFGDPRVFDIGNYGKGEVDYVVRERPGSGMLATDRFHYFECKNYSRSLDLDSVAKVMVVAVSDQPLSVHVVSRTPLQPQIRKYASRLFSFDGSANPIFRSVEFRHWQTGAILGDDEGESEPGVKSVAGLGFIAPGLSEVHWWLSECAAFSEVEIASSESARQPLNVQLGALLTLTMESADAGSAEISLDGLPNESWRYVTPLDGSEKGHYLIDTAYLATGEDYRISLKMMHQTTDHRIPLVHLRASGAASFLPELRTEEIADLIARMGFSGDTRLILVEGEAGVGKTHLIEKVAEELRAKASFDILRFTVPEEPDDELMASVIRNCLAPAIEKSAFGDLVSKIESALLRQESGGSLKMDFRLLVRAASRMGPRVIVLRDCHQVTPKLADEIWMLISVLDDSSWGGIRLVLEYRQPDAHANSALQGLLRKIRLNIRKVLLERQITPLGREAFYRFSKLLFAHITDELIACLFNRTGGVPLFLDSYLLRLQNLGLIRRGEKAPLFEISEPARILADSLPEGRQIILEERVRTGLAQAFPEDWKQWAIVLGLIATADNTYGQSLILDALGMSERESHVFQAMLKETGIGSALPDGQIVFRHDLLREAVAAVATAVEEFASRARQVADDLLAHKLPSDEVKVRAIRVKIFALLNDDVSCELELRNALKAAQEVHDYGRIVSFLNHLLPLLKDRPNVHERLVLMKELAWANWVSDSLLVARERYIQLATEAERNAEGDFSFSEAIATDAYRRAIGLDLELMEPYVFLENVISVLGRRQDHVTFNSILNRLVLFCARFGLPEDGYRFARLAFDYIGDGKRENEGSVLCSELGMLHASSSPETALDLFRRAHAMAHGKPEQNGTMLAIHVNECLYHGKALDIAHFDTLWAECSEHRLTEPLARASLLRGTLLLRESNLKSATHWIERTATMVQLYHMKQFELAILNDQVLHALLSGDTTTATNIFGKLVLEFERVEAQTSRARTLVEKTFEAAEKAASTLLAEPSAIERPAEPPAHCNPAAEMRQNIVAFASLLGLDEIAQTYTAALQAWPCPEVSEHRHVEVRGVKLILGAY